MVFFKPKKKFDSEKFFKMHKKQVKYLGENFEYDIKSNIPSVY